MRSFVGSLQKKRKIRKNLKRVSKMGVLQVFFVILFTCVSLSIGKHHHHRLHPGLLHNRKGLNVGENVKFLHGTGNSARYHKSKRARFEVAKKKDDIIGAEEIGAKRDGELDKSLAAIKIQLDELVKKSGKKPSPTLITSTNFADPLKNMKAITMGVDKTIPALKDFAEGIKKKDGFKIATSALTISAAVSLTVGGPIGMIIATVLNLAKVIIEMCKPVEKSESQEEMLQRVITEALQEFRAHDLMASFTGFTKKYEMLESNLKSVDDFLGFSMKDVGSEGNPQKYVTTDAFGKPVKAGVDQQMRFSKLKYTMANEIMPLANDVMYDGVDTLGKIQYEIDNVCDVDSTITDDKNREVIAKKCLKMLELYCQMSFQRRFSYISQLVTTLQKVIENKEVDDITRAKAIVHLRLIADNLKVTEEQDIKVLEFLVKPIYNYKRRYVINYYYSYLHQYKHLSIYVQSLPIESKHGVFVCSSESLLGNCKELPVNGVPDKGDKVFDFSKGTFVPMSLIVPNGYTVEVKYGDPGVFTPFTVYGKTTASSLYIEKKEKKTKEIIVAKSSKYEQDSPKVQMCRLSDDPTEIGKPHKGICKHILLDTMKIEYFSGTQKDPETTKWKNTYKSFNIPNSIAVIGQSVHSGMNFYWGPFYGSRVIPKACGSLMWTSVIAVDYSDKDQMKRFEDSNTLQTLCKADKSSEICGLTNVDSSTQFLELCKEGDLKGYCDLVPISKLDVNTTEQIINLDYIHVHAEMDGKLVDLSSLQKFQMTLVATTFNEVPVKKPFNSDFDDCIWKPIVVKKTVKNVLRSLKVPDGVKVELWTEPGGKGTLYGTYVGPVRISSIDGNLGEDSLINSLRITFSTQE